MDGGPVSTEVTGGIARLLLGRAPGNALDAEMRRALAAALDRIEEIAPRGVVITGGDDFSVGLDLRVLDAPEPDAPSLAALCDRIEHLPIPVVAALNGAVIGGGAELALAAHYRIAAPGARIGLPDIVLGLPPGAGGGQRLAALCGAEAAMDLLLRGRPVGAEAARRAGLLDALVEEDAIGSAMALAGQLAAAGIRPRPVTGRRDRMEDGIGWLDAVAHRRRALRDTPLRSAQRIVDCVEAALLLPPGAALRFERTAHRDALGDPQFAALRHVYFAERRIAPALLARGPAGPEITAQGRGLLAALSRGVEAHPPERQAAAVLAQGARLLAAGQVARSADLDALAVHGLGWPRLTGGPFHAARVAGFADLVDRMRGWAATDPAFELTPLLRAALATDGDLDAALRQGAAAQIRTG